MAKLMYFHKWQNSLKVLNHISRSGINRLELKNLMGFPGKWSFDEAIRTLLRHKFITMVGTKKKFTLYPTEKGLVFLAQVSHVAKLEENLKNSRAALIQMLQ